MKILWLFALFCLIIFVSCEETLPPRIVPTDTLHLIDVVATQGADGGGLVLVILIIGENIYEETFHDTVSLSGDIHIYMKKNPEVEAHVSLHNYHFTDDNKMRGRILTLDPGEKFFIKAKWYFITDEGKSVLDYLTFKEYADNGFLHAYPEKFIIEVKATIFEQTGIIEYEPIEITVEAWKKVDLGDG